MSIILDDGAQYKLQTLARHQTIEYLLRDINADMLICRIDGWDEMEFIKMIREEIDKLPRKTLKKEMAKGSERPKSWVICSECHGVVSRFATRCNHCGVEFYE